MKVSRQHLKSTGCLALLLIFAIFATCAIAAETTRPTATHNPDRDDPAELHHNLSDSYTLTVTTSPLKKVSQITIASRSHTVSHSQSHSPFSLHTADSSSHAHSSAHSPSPTHAHSSSLSRLPTESTTSHTHSTASSTPSGATTSTHSLASATPTFSSTSSTRDILSIIGTSAPAHSMTSAKSSHIGSATAPTEAPTATPTHHKKSSTASFSPASSTHDILSIIGTSAPAHSVASVGSSHISNATPPTETPTPTPSNHKNSSATSFPAATSSETNILSFLSVPTGSHSPTITASSNHSLTATPASSSPFFSASTTHPHNHSMTHSLSASATPSGSYSLSASATPSGNHSLSVSATPSGSYSFSASATPSGNHSLSASATPSGSYSFSASATPSGNYTSTPIAANHTTTMHSLTPSSAHSSSLTSQLITTTTTQAPLTTTPAIPTTTTTTSYHYETYTWLSSFSLPSAVTTTTPPHTQPQSTPTSTTPSASPSSNTVPQYIVPNPGVSVPSSSSVVTVKFDYLSYINMVNDYVLTAQFVQALPPLFSGGLGINVDDVIVLTITNAGNSGSSRKRDGTSSGVLISLAVPTDNVSELSAMVQNRSSILYTSSNGNIASYIDSQYPITQNAASTSPSGSVSDPNQQGSSQGSSPDSNSNQNGLSRGSIIGIAVSVGVVVYAAATIGMVTVYRRRKLHREQEEADERRAAIQSISAPIMLDHSFRGDLVHREQLYQ